MEEVNETPDISEDESIQSSNHTDIIDSSIYLENSYSLGIVNRKGRTIPIISDSESSDNSNDVVEISSEEESNSWTNEQKHSSDKKCNTQRNVPVRQTTIKEFLPNIDREEKVVELSQKLEVSSNEYKQQKHKIADLQVAIRINQSLYNATKDKLPDKGTMLLTKHNERMKELMEEEQKLSNMIVTEDSMMQPMKNASWEKLQAGLSEVQPRTFGQRAMETLNTQKVLTMDRLEQLHGSLKTCPNEDVHEKDPGGLKVELMQHQKHALAWLLWREKQKPSGGILADDMGLGKTLTMISLILRSNEIRENESDETQSSRSRNKYDGRTLVVCPASLVHQWKEEIKKRVENGLLTIDLYHGNTRETKSKRLAKYDIVITTYSLVLIDYNKKGPLFGIKWRRIILDEAHQVRNHKSQSSIAICNLSATSRWALTGTPVHNKELDLYSLLKFLRCTPFDDLAVWKRWVANKQSGGQDRLSTVMASLILRRTKQQLEEKQLLTCLPEKMWELIEVKLETSEMEVYQKFLIFSKTLFAQYLKQRAEKENPDLNNLFDKPEYLNVYRTFIDKYKVKKIKQHEILVLLLRLRQICCHPNLLLSMLEHGENDDVEQDADELHLLNQLKALSIDNNHEDHTNVVKDLSSEDGVGLHEACKNLVNPSNPVFRANRKSSKLKIIMDLVKRILPSGEKIIIISQWTKLLALIATQLKQDNINYNQLDGTVPIQKRMDIVQNINDSSGSVKINILLQKQEREENQAAEMWIGNINILLLSLTAGGVGLNLIGANNLILTDLHWNPQLEMQAQDRIYRVGQTKSVKMFKLMAVDTIEERIKTLQEKKLNLAAELLSGAKIQQTKLSLNDIKMLFNM